MATAIENSIQNFKVRFQSSQLGMFFSWWLTELRNMLPARVQAGLQHAQRRVIMRLWDKELSVSLHESDQMQELDVIAFDQDSELQRQRLADLLAERDLAEVGRYLLLPESRILRKTVILPIAAEANLRQALAFEMDRQTPFRAEDVFFDYRVTSRDKENAQLRIDLLVTQNQAVLKDVQLLHSLGMSPSGVDVLLDGTPAGINLLPAGLRHRIVNSRSRFNLILAGLVGFLLVFVMLQSLWLRQHQIAEVTEAIEDVRVEALQVQQIRDRINDASEAAGFLMMQRSASVPTVKVLAEVTRILPDDTFLDRLLINTETVQMQGKSQNAQQLIELVNQSPMFVDAAFRGSTRLDSRTQREIFDISASLVVGSGN